MNVGVSIGLAEINAESETLASVMSAADVACYSAKDSGRNRVQTYRQGRAPERHREMQWVSRINRACEEDRLRAALPADRADPRRRRDAAALRAAAAHARRERPARAARGIHPGGGALQPDARDRPLGRARGLPRSSRIAAATRHARAFTCSPINISATTINDEQFLDFVIAEMSAADVSPGALCFELTETAAMTQPRRVDALHP